MSTTTYNVTNISRDHCIQGSIDEDTIKTIQNALKHLPDYLNELKTSVGSTSEFTFDDSIITTMIEAINCSEFSGKYIDQVNVDLLAGEKIIPTFTQTKAPDEVIISTGGTGDDDFTQFSFHATNDCMFHLSYDSTNEALNVLIDFQKAVAHTATTNIALKKVKSALKYIAHVLALLLHNNIQI